jgi:hypothetical protein
MRGRASFAGDDAGGIATMVLKRLFPAHGSDGRDYEVHVYAETVHEGVHPSALPIEHLTTIVTSTGLGLRILGHGRYRIEDTGVILTSHDPDAI